MATSQARIDANRLNAQRSTGPGEAGKAASRANSYKHGLTGAGVVLAEKDAAEVERKAAAYAREMNAQGEAGQDLARRAALNMVRMNRCVDQQSAALAERVRKAEADFVPPEGVDEDEAEKLRSEAGRIAMFDPGPEATLIRKYEASAERAYFRCLKELKQMQARPQAAPPPPTEAEFDAMMQACLAQAISRGELDDPELGSFLQDPEPAEMTDAEYEEMCQVLGSRPPRMAADSPLLALMRGQTAVPISAGRRR